MTFDSDISLPEMMPAHGPADVEVRYGRVAAPLEDPSFSGPRFQVAPGRYQLDMEGVARFRVRNGDTVTIDPAPGAEERDIRVFVLSSVTGALLHQRGLLPLHASAVRVDGGCVLFAGPSGTGKSTLATAFHGRGYELLADDVCAVELDSAGAPLVHAGHRDVKLWRDALEHFGECAAEADRIRGRLDKFNVRLSGGGGSEPVPLRAVYILRPGLEDGVSLERLMGSDSASAILRETYRRKFIAGPERLRAHLLMGAAVARHCSVVDVQHRRSLEGLDTLVACLEAHTVQRAGAGAAG